MSPDACDVTALTRDRRLLVLLPQSLGVRAMAAASNPSSGRGQKKHEESASSGEVPVEARKGAEAQAGAPAAGAPGGEMQRTGGTRRRGTASPGAISPFLGGGLASVLPRMMMPTLPGMLSSADPFGSLLSPLQRGGPFGMADKLLHDLEDDMRTLTQQVLGDVEPEESALALTDILPGRLWAAVDVKETPTEYVLSTDVRPAAAKLRSLASARRCTKLPERRLTCPVHAGAGPAQG